MKNSSGRPISEYADAVAPGAAFYFHSGKAARCYEDLLQGAVGATLSMAIYYPEICIQLYALVKEGRLDEAAKVSEEIKRFNAVGPSQYGVPGVKYAMDLRGYYGGEPRLPLLPLTETEKAQQKNIFSGV